MNSGPQSAATCYAPSADECTYATLAHALQLVGGWIGPLVILLVKRESKFVSFHALQALLLQACVLVFIMLCMGVFMISIIATFASAVTTAGHPSALPPPAFFLFPFIWLFVIASWISVLVAAIVYAIKAGRGEWAEYPVLGHWAKRILRIPEPGAAAS